MSVATSTVPGKEKTAFAVGDEVVYIATDRAAIVRKVMADGIQIQYADSWGRYRGAWHTVNAEAVRLDV